MPSLDRLSLDTDGLMMDESGLVTSLSCSQTLYPAWDTHIHAYKCVTVHLTVRIRSSYFLWGCQLSSLVGNLLSFTSQSSLPKSCGEEEKWHIQLQFKDLNWQHVISSEPWTRNGMGIFPTIFQPHDVRDMQKVCVCVCVWWAGRVTDAVFSCPWSYLNDRLATDCQLSRHNFQCSDWGDIFHLCCSLRGHHTFVVCRISVSVQVERLCKVSWKKRQATGEFLFKKTFTRLLDTITGLVK